MSVDSPVFSTENQYRIMYGMAQQQLMQISQQIKQVVRSIYVVMFWASSARFQYETERNGANDLTHPIAPLSLVLGKGEHRAHIWRTTFFSVVNLTFLNERAQINKYLLICWFTLHDVSGCSLFAGTLSGVVNHESRMFSGIGIAHRSNNQRNFAFKSWKFCFLCLCALPYIDD